MTPSCGPNLLFRLVRGCAASTTIPADGPAAPDGILTNSATGEGPALWSASDQDLIRSAGSACGACLPPSRAVAEPGCGWPLLPGSSHAVEACLCPGATPPGPVTPRRSRSPGS